MSASGMADGRRRSGERSAAQWARNAVFRPLAVLAAGALLATAAQAQSSSIEGTWRGSGYVSYASGDKERVTCRATYTRISGDAYTLNATCASPSGSVSQSATVLDRGGGTYRGDIFNVQYNTYGSIVVEVSGNSQRVTLRGEAGSGVFTLTRR